MKATLARRAGPLLGAASRRLLRAVCGQPSGAERGRVRESTVSEPAAAARDACGGRILRLALVTLMAPAVAQADPAAVRAASLAASTQRLRSEVSSDYRRAFRELGSAGIEKKVVGWDEELWEGVNPRIGWGFLLGGSPAVLGGYEGETPVTAFYHPWSDVVFLVAWRADGPAARIHDVALLDASLVRSPEAPTLGPDPAWAESNEYAPLALARQTADVISAFERLYPPGFSGDWRQPLPWIEDETFAELNRSAVSLRLSRAIAMFAALRLPFDRQPPAIARLAAGAERLRTGDVESLIAEARHTPVETREVLRLAPAGGLASLVTIGALPGEEAGVVFLTPRDAPDFFAAILVGRSRLERIDVVTYRGLGERLGSGR